MAELLPSSDDESLCGDDHEPVETPAVRRDDAPTRALSPRGKAALNGSQEPEEELMESMFSLKKRPYLAKKPRFMDELFPLTPSPPNETTEAAETSRVHAKPVVSARAMLMQFLPKSSRLSVAMESPPRTQPIKRTLDMDKAKEEESGWTKRAKPTPMTESERIARKYGLLPRGDFQARAATAKPVEKHGSSRESKDTTVSSSPRREEERRPRAAPTPVSKREIFWKSQVAIDDEKEETKSDQASYVSPFARRDSGGFRDMRRRRETREVPTVDKETFYTDDAQQAAQMNRPRHVIASKLTAEEDDQGWLSDAKEIDSDEEQVASPGQGKTSAARTSSSSIRAGAPSRKRSRPTTQKVLSDDELDDVESFESNRWPMLPPAKCGDLGPLKLQSPTGEEQDLEVCANINSYLFDYQREGVQFLLNAYIKRTGAILGDEMGLGKTIQVIALLSAILRKHGDYRDKEEWRQVLKERRERDENGSLRGLSGSSHRNPILVVVPASLLHNWESELKIWMCCQTVILIGKPTDREQIIEQAAIGAYEIVICSYDVLKITLDKLKRVPWELIVFDEMHCLKNPDSQLTQAVKAIKCPRKLGLTGTLMQNNEKELHCLIDTIAPGVLGSWHEFRSFYGDDIKYGRKKSAVPEALERSRKKEKKLRQVLVPYYLRREKEINPSFQEIKKSDQVVFCDLTPFQLAAYKRILEMPEFELLRKGEELCDCGRDSGRKRKECCYITPASLGTDQRALLWERFHPDGTTCKSCPNCMGLVCVAQLLKLSNHMELLKVNPHDPPRLQQYQADFAATAFGDDADAVGGVQQVSTFQEMRAIGTQTCGKMLVLEKLLALWKKKRQKTLLFSRSTRMLDILQLFLVSKAVTYLRLDGQTKVEERLQLVNKFNDPESNISVFLISTRAGGLGLNLPTATNVVIFDPSWNPAHDCQAQDRAYRIGQTKDVQVYRLITLGTIEEMIYVRQIYKQQLSDTTLKGVKAPRYFEGVQGDRRQQGELFGIKNLLCWKESGVLKDIQDAYRRDRDGIMIQQNQVRYDNARTPPSTKKSRSRAKQEIELEDAEMVEVADEMTSGILNSSSMSDALTPPANDAKPEAAPAMERQESGGDGEEDTEKCLLQGARTFRHEEIVGEDDGEGNADPFSETDEEDEVVVLEGVSSTDAAKSPAPKNQTLVPSVPLIVTPAKPTPSATAHPSPSPRVSPPPSIQKSPSITALKARTDDGTPRKALYIPKYL